MRAVLITGSRKWADGARVCGDLERELEIARPGTLYILHGACPTGADAFAADWLVRRADGVHVIGFPLPAPWGEFGKGAGPRRNSEMVAVLGSLRRMGAITRCIGYPMPGGRGTRDCMGKAGGFSHEVLNHGTDGGAT